MATSAAVTSRLPEVRTLTETETAASNKAAQTLSDWAGKLKLDHPPEWLQSHAGRVMLASKVHAALTHRYGADSAEALAFRADLRKDAEGTTLNFGLRPQASPQSQPQPVTPETNANGDSTTTTPQAADQAALLNLVQQNPQEALKQIEASLGALQQQLDQALASGRRPTDDVLTRTQAELAGFEQLANTMKQAVETQQVPEGFKAISDRVNESVAKLRATFEKLRGLPPQTGTA